jgi:proline dehydrogenase
LSEFTLKAFLVNLLPSFSVKFFARAYVAGVGMECAIQKAHKLWNEQKIAATIDMLGEEVKNKRDVEKIVQIYLDLIERLAEEDFPRHVSVKPTSLGIDMGRDYCIENLTKILNKAKQYDTYVTLDMEDSNYTTITLDLYKTLKLNYEFGTVLQTRLFRTEEDIRQLKDLKGRVRVCIGVYNEDKSIAYTQKREMKRKLVEYTSLLLDEGHQVDIATHDHKCIIECIREIEKREVEKSDVEFQFLLGVPRKRIQQELVERDYLVRLYLPFTIEWKFAINYLRRRLIENPSVFYLGAKDFIGRILQPITNRGRKPILPPINTSR